MHDIDKGIWSPKTQFWCVYAPWTTSPENRRLQKLISHSVR